MTAFFEFFGKMWRDLRGVLHNFTFEMFGWNVSLWQVLLAFLIIGMVISIFWKGARA